MPNKWMKVWPHLIKVGLWLATAEVRQRPGGVAQHGELGVVLQLLKEGGQGTRLQHQIPAFGGVTRNVTQSPHCLQRSNDIIR